MSTFLLGIAALAVPFVLIALASSQESSGAPGGPGPDHAHLDAWVGTWDAEVEMMGQNSKGTETCRRALGDFWLVTDFDGSFLGAPYQGHGLTGLDAAGELLSIWADSTGGPASIARGRFSPDGQRFVAESQGVDMSGQPARFRHVTTFASRDARTFEIFQLAEGGREELALRIRYTRRGSKTGR